MNPIEKLICVAVGIGIAAVAPHLALIVVVGYGALWLFHKTVHHNVKGGEWSTDPDTGREVYRPSGKESACVGSLIFALKAGRTPVALRFALMIGDAQYGTLMAQSAAIIDPPNRKEPQ